ncbi:MAG: CvpA family protein [Butyrivibrio sp.]|nr:CvpA family protein [Butyrivibrio sp.]MBQ8031679.1 CvpA family protein [Butyrivibrio sp.]MBR1642828.1 CvpA family protein [Butyrivibrio sp.]
MNLEISQIVITIVVVILFLWRISYGTNNGLFAEAAGLIAVIAAFAAVYYTMNIAGNVMTADLGRVIPKIGYLIVAFAVYGIMTAIGRAVRNIKEIPILGGLDRLLGAVLGAIEAYLIVYIIVYITGFDVWGPVISLAKELYEYVKSMLA